MKKFTIGALLALSAITAQAQWNIQIPVPGGTNNVSAATTNSTYASVTQTGASFAVPNQLTLPIQVSFKLTGSGTTAVVFTFDESVDGSIWKASAQTLSITPAGTAVVNNTGRFTLSGMPYLRLQSIENANASAITNLTVKYIEKTSVTR